MIAPFFIKKDRKNTLTARLPDPFDEPFLEVALEGKVQYLVTGNLRHYPAEKCSHMTVLSPNDFLRSFWNSK
ncbi:MAG: PIN domain-containing protein [bacterium]